MQSGILGICTGFLTPGRLLASPKKAPFRGRGLSGWRGGCASRYGEAGVGVGEDKDLWSRTAPWRKLVFPGSGGRTARASGIVAVARVAHRSGIEMTILWAWDSRFCWS